MQAALLLGNAMAGLKDFEGAVKELEEAAQLDPRWLCRLHQPRHGASPAGQQARGGGRVPTGRRDRPEQRAAPHLALAQYLLGTGALKEAEAELLKAHEVDPKNALAIRALAAFYTALNRPADSEKYLKLLVANDTSPARASTLMLAEFYIASRRYDEAIAVLKPLLDRRETVVGAQTRIAFAEFAQGKKADAYRDVDAVLKREPRNAMALITKSRFLVSDKKLRGGVELCQAGRGRGPGIGGRALPRRQHPRRARSSRRGDRGLQRSDSIESARRRRADAARAVESAEGRSRTRRWISPSRPFETRRTAPRPIWRSSER